MSFTPDELQALNALFDQKMTTLRQDLDRSLDLRMQAMRRDFEQHQTNISQDLLRTLARRLNEQQHYSRDSLYQRLELLQKRNAQILQQDLEQRFQQQEHTIEQALAAQLLAFEQIIKQQIVAPTADLQLVADGAPSEFDTIEVQTEIPWEDLVDLVDKLLLERLAEVSAEWQAKLQDLERALVVQLHILRDQLLQNSLAPSGQREPGRKMPEDMQDVFASINQLEQLIESMQVAMTANTALLSNRLYHHQHLPLERAHLHQTHSTTIEQTDDERPLHIPLSHVEARE